MLDSFFEGMAGSLGWAFGFLIIGLVGWLAYRHFIGRRIDFVKSLPGKGLREVIKAPGSTARKVKKLTEGVNIPSISLSKLRGREESVTELIENEVQVSGREEVVKAEKTVTKEPSVKKTGFSKLKSKLPSRPEWTRRGKKK